MEFRVIIPVRYHSRRLPGKPLLDIGGKPMVQHVYEQSCKSGAISVVIATDDERIEKAARKFGADVCMTSPDHQSGSERLAEAVTALGYEEDEIVVNVQGDEPLIPPAMIQLVGTNLTKYDNIKLATLCTPIKNTEELFDPNVVKVVLNRRGFALYFSRAAIPWDRANFPPKKPHSLETQQNYRHIGLYAYRVGFLHEYMKWESCPIEELESLEQLRVLWYGGRIQVGITKEKVPMDINTEEDLAKIRAMF